MALIQFPTLEAPFDERYTNADLEPWHPGQEGQQNPYTGDQSVFSRSPGRWRGVVRIAAVNDEAEAGLIEAWFAALRGAENWTNLPLARPPIPSAISVSSINLSASSISTPNATGIRAGMYCLIGTRLLIVEAVVGNNLTIWPYVPALVAGVTLRPAETVLARRPAGRGVTMLREQDIYGPWTFEWQEKV